MALDMSEPPIDEPGGTSPQGERRMRLRHVLWFLLIYPASGLAVAVMVLLLHKAAGLARAL